VLDLLPGGHREGREWRVGSLAGEDGSSLGVHRSGVKAGVWSDFATGEKGDALGLVRATLNLDTTEATKWSLRWLGANDRDSALPTWPSTPKRIDSETSNRWRYPWQKACPIIGTEAETYLASRRHRFDDPKGRVFRFAQRRARKRPLTDVLECHPALLCALSD